MRRERRGRGCCFGSRWRVKPIFEERKGKQKKLRWSTKMIKQDVLFWTYYKYLTIAKGRKKKCAAGRGEERGTRWGVALETGE